MNYLGTIIRDTRLSKGLTQKELSKDLCSIKQLSRIENNENSPSAVLLSEFSSRLGNSIEAYIKYSDCPNGFLVKHELDHINQEYLKHNYQEVLHLLSTSINLDKTSSHHAIKEKQWLMAAIANHIDVPETIDTQYFYNVLQIKDEIWSLFERLLVPIEYKLINSFAIYLLYKEHKNALALRILKEAISNYERYYDEIIDSCYPRLVYNLTWMTYNERYIKETIPLADKGINHCLKHNNITYLADLNLMKGKALWDLGREEKGSLCLKNYLALRHIYYEDHLDTYKDTIDFIERRYGIVY